jgi:hypothetical protein
MASSRHLSAEQRRRLGLCAIVVVVSCFVLVAVGAWEVAGIYAVLLLGILAWVTLKLRRS